MVRRRKFCKSCVGRYYFDYKDARFLSQFISDNGRIVPRRISGACAQCQRKITLAVKRARHLALLPYVRR
jgi:small subunit ribosomal protein S18